MHTESAGKVGNEMIYSMLLLSIFRFYLSFFVYPKTKVSGKEMCTQAV